MTPTLIDRIIEGIRDGIIRQWMFAKDLLTIKPEYLLTVSVADAIIRGFEEVSGLDVTVRLERPTADVRRDLVLDKVGWDDYFRADLTPISRQGFLDIYVKIHGSSHIVELKNIDPPMAEIEKEVIRLSELLLVNGGLNHLKSCHLAFPSSQDELIALHKIVSTRIDPRLTFTIAETDKVITGEDPEDGLPAYSPVCVTLTRRI